MLLRVTHLLGGPVFPIMNIYCMVLCKNMKSTTAQQPEHTIHTLQNSRGNIMFLELEAGQS